jgi:hypothetical protein
VQHNNSGRSEHLFENPPASGDLYEEIALIRESLNQTRSELSLFRRRIERRQGEVDAHILHTNILWIVMLLFIGGLCSVIVYGYFSGALIVRSPIAQTSSLGPQGHLSSPLERTIPANNASESTQERTPVPAFSPEPGETKVTNAIEDVPGVPPQQESTPAVSASPKSDRGAHPNSSGTGLLADAVRRNRIDFELYRNKTKEVAPGIFLTVWDMDVEHQQINGSLQISSEGRTVSLRGQGTQKVMIFATKSDVRSHELIFTRIGKQDVSGYLLIPTTTIG